MGREERWRRQNLVMCRKLERIRVEELIDGNSTEIATFIRLGVEEQRKELEKHRLKKKRHRHYTS